MIKNELTKKMIQLRHTSHRGSVINPHHSLFKIQFTPEILASMILIPILFNILEITYIDTITILWEQIFVFFTDMLDLHVLVKVKHTTILFKNVSIHYPALSAQTPTLIEMIIAACILPLLCYIALSLPDRYIPISYILYLISFILFTSLFYFSLSHPTHFNLGKNIVGNLKVCLQLLFIIPWMLGFTYNIFPFSLARKLLLTTITVLYFIILYPFQFMLYAALIYKFSLLYLAPIHFIFTVFFDVMIFIALYAWGMSWEEKKSII